MSKVSYFPQQPTRKPARCPDNLAPPERALWRKILTEYRIDDAASLAVLQAGLESLGRARSCREAIDRDGEVTRNRYDELVAHPLLTAERTARAGFLAAMRALRLDIGAGQ
jgi:hypothetical protein